MEQMFHVPVKDSSSSVENILRPISYMSWLLGVGIAHPQKFQILNKLIGQLNKLSNVQWIAFKIIRIRELHADICDLASMVNDIYALHLLFFSMNCFTMAAAALFNFYIAIIHGYPRVLIYSFYQIVYVMQFWLICWICTLACQEANITGKIIHKIVLNCKPVNLDTHEASNQSRIEVRPSLEDYNGEQNSNCSRRHNLYVVGNFLCRNLDREYVTKEVNDFLTQLQQNRVAFSACDFFEINNASFGCLVGVIFTYLIIFIQFYEDPKIENKS
ncbi:uncharacterized protein LOC105195382 isoform X2 [Solenopsis invicta]|uniref:uncharacterized protein LOC105195382 isoform X2 n=1 Tax=Solenopsis invicta TaxID=13686 RepID=UPI00193D1021|nr:uncharacterized protein LOC105195382 isoform X2 [Solenopsis invicta]